MNAFTALQYVTSGLTLAAFVSVLVVGAIRHKVSQREAMIKAALSNQRAEMATVVLERFGIDTKPLTNEQKYDLAVAQLKERTVRLRTMLRFALLVLVAACASVAIAAHTPTNDTLNASDQEVIHLKEQVLKIRGDFEALAKYPNERPRVMEEEKKLGEKLSAVSDTSLDSYRKILKYQYSAYAFVLAAATANTDDQKTALADRANTAANAAIAIYEQNRASALAGDENATSVYQWIVDDDSWNRTLYLVAWADAINVIARKTSSLQDVLDTLGKIDCVYLAKYPPSRDYELGQVLGGESGDLPCRKA